MICSPVLPSAANSSARRSLRTMSSAECRFRPAMSLIVPSSPYQGQRDSNTKRSHSLGTGHPHWSDVRVRGVSATRFSLRFEVAATARTAACTLCGRPSDRVHSRYDRRLADHAVSWREVSIRLQARRFRRVNADCPRSIFAEQIPGLAERYRRRSSLLTTLLTKIGLALGGRPGQRMTRTLGASVSRSTLLRLVRGLAVPELGTQSCSGTPQTPRRSGHSTRTRCSRGGRRCGDQLDQRGAGISGFGVEGVEFGEEFVGRYRRLGSDDPTE